MSFTDTLKRSLGFEESLDNKKNNNFGNDFRRDFSSENYTIFPEQSFYEIILIRPKSSDDMDYVVDQVVEENNPVILDLSFLEKKSPRDFRMAGNKLKYIRENHGAEAFLLAQCKNKNLIIVSPKRVNLMKKD
ncbi:cell division protein SepF [Methanobrevibacter sp. DSM 116169]|uniref:cell division protein SepF n=1 Tax=Methanobrevibacter sp. DSM 116169 TaxID=3242727 RepID=UPI0038FC2BD5